MVRNTVFVFPMTFKKGFVWTGLVDPFRGFLGRCEQVGVAGGY